jgi:hypothetical protein
MGGLLMAESERRLDQAINELIAGDRTATEPSDELSELVALARRLRALPADQWPDPAFPHRLTAELSRRQPGAGRLSARARQRVRTLTGWASRRRPLALAALTAALVFAFALVISLNRTPSVSAAVLARDAAAASSGHGLASVRFTQVITNWPVPGSFEPEPPAPRVVEQVTFASAERWRVQATVTEPYHEGTERTLTVRNGDTVVSVNRSSYMGTTETRMHAATGAGLPTEATYGSRIDPLALLRSTAGRCGRHVSPVHDGPLVIGRRTLVLRLGPNPCPSAAAPEVNGPASFLIDAQTHLVLDAKVFAPDGHTLVQQLQTTQLAYTGRIATGLFRLPPRLPTLPQHSARVLPPSVSRSHLRAHAAFTTLLPGYLPPGIQPQALTQIATQASTGKLLAFTITYVNAAGRPVFQLYEAPAASPSVRFPGRRVTIRPGIAGTYSAQPPTQILWWIQDGTYCSIQQGGSSAGIRLSGTFPFTAIRAVAASMS